MSIDKNKKRPTKKQIEQKMSEMFIAQLVQGGPGLYCQGSGNLFVCRNSPRTKAKQLLSEAPTKE